ncbi:phospho-2-dehydro-3-deoxyheptonate aldolase, partial [Bifidobacteriaceae bacterium WP022]
TGCMASNGVVVDCSHGNSGKDERRQIEVVREIADRLADGEQGIKGVMMESFLQGGNQDPAPLSELEYGKSITDRCISWEDTANLLRILAKSVATRRRA